MTKGRRWWCLGGWLLRRMRRADPPPPVESPGEVPMAAPSAPSSGLRPHDGPIAPKRKRDEMRWHVAYDKGQCAWRVTQHDADGKSVFGAYATQEWAVRMAAKAARESSAPLRRVFIHRKRDGRITDERTYPRQRDRHPRHGERYRG